jgi:hypothetical protein
VIAALMALLVLKPMRGTLAKSAPSASPEPKPA